MKRMGMLAISLRAFIIDFGSSWGIQEKTPIFLAANTWYLEGLNVKNIKRSYWFGGLSPLERKLHHLLSFNSHLKKAQATPRLVSFRALIHNVPLGFLLGY